MTASVAAPGAGVRKMDRRAAATWLIAAVSITYIGLDGGGYATTVWASVGVIFCWGALVGALLALGRACRPTPAGWVMICALAALTVWSAVGLIWSESAERTLTGVARDATYLGVLAIAVGGVRARYARHLVAGVATGIVVIAVVALLSRMFPGSFGKIPTYSLLSSAPTRLSYPLSYWNALAELIAIGIPLVWGLATQARTPLRQAATASVLPLLVLTLTLTLSRGGLLALALAALTYLLLAPNRWLQLATALNAAVGGGLLTLVAYHLPALRQGLATNAARHDGVTLLIVTVVVCAGAAAVQFVVGVAFQRQTLIRLGDAVQRGSMWLRWRSIVVPLLLGAVAALVLLGIPHRLAGAWNRFEHPPVAENLNPGRLATLNGNGRDQFWRASLLAVERHPRGLGTGSWEFWWTRTGNEAAGYAANAHSLFFETLAEDGIPGGVLIVVFLGAAIIGVVRRARCYGIDKTSFAAIAAACAAFVVAALSDWAWQVPVVSISFLALMGAALGSEDEREHRPTAIAVRLLAILASVACLVSIAIPLAAALEVQDSQAAVARGAFRSAVGFARTAERIEPYGATPWLQAALALELDGDLRRAEGAARRAQANEPDNWRPPLMLARILAERGQASASRRSARHALLLNPTLPTLLPAAPPSPSPSLPFPLPLRPPVRIPLSMAVGLSPSTVIGSPDGHGPRTGGGHHASAGGRVSEAVAVAPGGDEPVPPSFPSALGRRVEVELQHLKVGPRKRSE